MNLIIELNLGDGPFTVKPSLFAVIEWERRFKSKISRIQTDGLGYEDLAFLAYTQIKAEKILIVPPVFDDFAKKIITLDVLESDEDPRPTEGATDTPSA